MNSNWKKIFQLSKNLILFSVLMQIGGVNSESVASPESAVVAESVSSEINALNINLRPDLTRRLEIRKLPHLPINQHGFVLQKRSAMAEIRHQKFYQTNKLKLIGGQVETHAQYQDRLNAHYQPGEYRVNLNARSLELTNALRSGPSTGTINPDFDLAEDRILLKFKKIDPRIIKMLRSKNGLVDIVIPATLYNSNVTTDVYVKTHNTNKLTEKNMTVKKAVDRYMRDLEAAGYWTQLYTISGGSPASIKNTLKADQKYGLVGAVMIGESPTPWCRDTHDFDNSTSEFPCDIFYMALDANFGTPNSSGQYTVQAGSNIIPDIWVGRIKGNLPILGKKEEQIIIEYLSRNHFFRTKDRVNFPQQLFAYTSTPSGLQAYYRSLAYQDDDWSSSDYSLYLSNLTNERVLVNGGSTTVASDYMRRISEVPGGFWYLHLMAHSSPTSHAFKIGSAWSGGSVDASQLMNTYKRAHFYNLFNCSGARFTTDNFFGGIYVFGNPYGLGAIGSTKTGSMLAFDVYYANLAGKLRAEDSGMAHDWDVVVGKKATFGTAYLKWFRYIAKNGLSQDEVNWHFGMTYLGDPTLYPDWDLNTGSRL